MPAQMAPLSRRRFCLCRVGATAAAGAWLTSRQAFAEARGLVTLIKDSAAASPIVTHRLDHNLAALEGSGGAVAVSTGPDGKLLVDAGIGISRPRMTRALADLGAEPITNLVNSHWHFDHTDGNTWLNASGAKIIAHENTRGHLSRVERVADWDYNFLALPAGGLPSEVFSTERTLQLNGHTVVLRSHAPAHTDSDISATFVEANVVHVGDTLWNGVYPFIDYSTGGSIDGMIAASDTNLAATRDDTVIIAGHGKTVGTRRDLQEFREMLVSVREKVAALKREGRSPDEAAAARPTAAFDAKFGAFVIDPGLFTRLVHEGV